MSKYAQKGIISSLLLVIALSLCPVRADNYSGSFIEEGIENQTFYNAFTYCQNPSFGTSLPTGVSGAMFGLYIQSSYPSNIEMGYTVGKYKTASSAHAGTFVENSYQSGSQVINSYYPFAAPTNTNDPSFATASNSNNQYYDAYINGAVVVSNLFKGSATSSSMAVGIYDSGILNGPSLPNFPSFTNGSNCSAMQTYYSGSSYNSWVGNSTLFYYAEAPSGEQSAHGTYTSSSNQFAVYYN